MNISGLLDCPPDRVTLFVAARFAGRQAAEDQFEREKDNKPKKDLYISDRIEEDKAAKVEFAISYVIRLKELRDQHKVG